jgi:hypothetical protein
MIDVGLEHVRSSWRDNVSSRPAKAVLDSQSAFADGRGTVGASDRGIHAKTHHGSTRSWIEATIRPQSLT